MSELAARKRTMNRQRMRSPALRLAKRCFVLLALGMSLILSGCRPEPPFPLREVIPEGPVQVDVMQLGLPRRAVEIVQRLEAHLAEHPEWWSEHVRSAPEGEPIPYDPRMGISEAEYLEFLELASAGTLNKVGEATLDFQWVSSRRVRLGAEGELAALNGIEIDVVLQRLPPLPSGRCRSGSRSTTGRSRARPGLGGASSGAARSSRRTSRSGPRCNWPSAG